MPHALEKEAAREFTGQTVIAGLAPMLRAQMAHATGIGHCYTRDKHGKFSRVENLDEIGHLLTEGTGRALLHFRERLSAVAFQELLDRALDKPKGRPRKFTSAARLN
jgi:hypothetical protein